MATEVILNQNFEGGIFWVRVRACVIKKNGERPGKNGGGVKLTSINMKSNMHEWIYRRKKGFEFFSYMDKKNLVAPQNFGK